MDALKWILKASIALAMMFFGLQAEPQKKEQPDSEKNTLAFIQLIKK